MQHPPGHVLARDPYAVLSPLPDVRPGVPHGVGTSNPGCLQPTLQNGDLICLQLDDATLLRILDSQLANFSGGGLRLLATQASALLPPSGTDKNRPEDEADRGPEGRDAGASSREM